MTIRAPGREPPRAGRRPTSVRAMGTGIAMLMLPVIVACSSSGAAEGPAPVGSSAAVGAQTMFPAPPPPPCLKKTTLTEQDGGRSVCLHPGEDVLIRLANPDPEVAIPWKNIMTTGPATITYQSCDRGDCVLVVQAGAAGVPQSVSASWGPLTPSGPVEAFTLAIESYSRHPVSPPDPP